MVNEENYDDIDEYEAMEAEAEELAKQPVQQVQQPQAKRPMQQAQQSRPVQINNAPAKIERRGRPPKAQQPMQSKPVEVMEDTVEEELAQDSGEVETNEKLPKWIPYHQPEEVGIVNRETGEKIKSFKEEGAAIAMAKILNELDVIITGGGYQ